MFAFVAVLSAVFVSASAAILLRRRWARSKCLSPSVPSLVSGRYQSLERSMLGDPPVLETANVSGTGLAMSTVPRAGAGALVSGRQGAEAPTSYVPALVDITGWSSSEAKAESGSPGAGEPLLSPVPVVIDGAVPAAAYAWTWTQVDPHLFTAVSHLTHESIDSMADLGRAIEPWDSVSQWSSPSGALVSKVQGHLAEALAADHLKQAGHAVLIPPDSNQPAWDLDVDGHLTNVKSVADIGSVSGHFALHPDIAAIVPHDAIGIPADAVHFDPSSGIDFQAAHDAGVGVFVDDALSHAETVQSATDGVEVASGHVAGHFPWATAAVSAFRESRLLLKGHTDLTRAAENVAVDAIAVGGAGFAGMKGGAAIGAFFGPLGAAIGAGIGGVGGALLGRKVANSIKRIPLEGARESYEQSVSTYESEQIRAKADAESVWAAVHADQKASMIRQAETAKQDAAAEVDAARQALEQAKRLSAVKARALLDEAEHQLVDQERLLEEKSRRFAGWRRWLWADPEVLAAASGASAFSAFVEEWRKARATLEVGEQLDAEPVFDLAMTTRCGLEAARSQVVASGRARAEALARCVAARKSAIDRVAASRRQAVADLTAKAHELAAQVDSRLAEPLRSLKRTRVELVTELRKAGVQVEA